jgi:hypothetical protein
MTHHRKVPEPGEPLFGLFERLRGNINEVDACRAAGGLQRFRQDDELLPTAAAKLDCLGSSARSRLTSAANSARRLVVGVGMIIVGIRDSGFGTRSEFGNRHS